MAKIDRFLKGVRTAAIAGHVNPDGDCIGSCMGMYLYLRDNFPHIRADVYLQSYREVFSFVDGIKEAKSTCDPENAPDLLILMDVSGKERIGVASPLLDTASKTLCFDHHVTNTGGYTWCFNEPEASSACEVLYRFLDPEKISASCAAALYAGIVDDTGVFQYSSTSPETMRIAAALMEKGIPFSEIVDRTYYQRTFEQSKILGKVLLESELLFDGRLVIGSVSRQDMLKYHAEAKDMDGIVTELRNTIGSEVAVFLYEKEEGVHKVSLRSRSHVDVSRAARTLGGGGHVRAAGCDVKGSYEEAAAKVLSVLGPYMTQEAEHT